MLYIIQAAKVAAKKANINNIIEKRKIIYKILIINPPVILF